jgi:hypothetical protein
MDDRDGSVSDDSVSDLPTPLQSPQKALTFSPYTAVQFNPVLATDFIQSFLSSRFVPAWWIKPYSLHWADGMNDSDRLAAALRRDFADIRMSSDPAWSRAPALRVVDCVFSLNRRYDEFVVPRLDSLKREYPSLSTIRQLRELIDSFPSPAVFMRDALRYRDVARAQVLSDVVHFLLRMGVGTPGASDLERLKQWALLAHPADYRSLGIRGFGIAGFQYLRMLFGASTTKPDVHIRRYVAAAVGRPVSDVQALTLMEDAAARAGVPLRDADTTIWEHAARR